MPFVNGVVEATATTDSLDRRDVPNGIQNDNKSKKITTLAKRCSLRDAHRQKAQEVSGDEADTCQSKTTEMCSKSMGSPITRSISTQPH